MIPAPACDDDQRARREQQGVRDVRHDQHVGRLRAERRRVDARSRSSPPPVRAAGARRPAPSPAHRRLVEHGAEREVDDRVVPGGEEGGELDRTAAPPRPDDRTPAQQADVRPLVGRLGRQRRRADPQVRGIEHGRVGRPRRARRRSAPSRPTPTAAASRRDRGWRDGRPSPRRRPPRPAPSPRGRRGRAPRPTARGTRSAARRRPVVTKYSGDSAARPPDASCVQPIDQCRGRGRRRGRRARARWRRRRRDRRRGRQRQREDRVDVAVHRAAAEEDPHRAMMRPAGPGRHGDDVEIPGGLRDRRVVARQLLRGRRLEHVDERQQGVPIDHGPRRRRPLVAVVETTPELVHRARRGSAARSAPPRAWT